MELDDSFTENLLQRRKIAKEYLSIKKNDSPNPLNKKRAALVDEQQISHQVIENDKESPKRQCIKRSDENEKENIGLEKEENFVPFTASSNRGLSALRRKDPSDRHNEDATLKQVSEDSEVNKPQTYVFSTNSSDLCLTRKTRLANLASTINQWEDDLSQPPLTTNNVTSNSKSAPTISNPSSSINSFSVKLFYSERSSDSHGSGDSDDGVSGVCSNMLPIIEKGNIVSGSGSDKRGAKSSVWNEAVKATLETEVPLTSPVKKKTKWNDDGKTNGVEQELPKIDRIKSIENSVHVKNQNKNLSDVKDCSKKETTVLDKSLDPAELPLSARKALFEKAMIGGSVKTSDRVLEPKLSVAQRAAMFEKASTVNSKPKPPVNCIPQKKLTVQNVNEPTKVSSIVTPIIQDIPARSFPSILKEDKPVSPKKSPVKKINPETTELPMSPSKAAGQHTRLIQQQLVEQAASNWQEKDIVANAVNERKKEISSLVSHWEKLSSSSSVGNSVSEEEQLTISKVPEDVQDPHYSEEESELESEPNDSRLESEGSSSRFESDYIERKPESVDEQELESVDEQELESVDEQELESELGNNTHAADDAINSSVSDHEEPDVFHPTCSTIDEELSNFEEDTVDDNENIKNRNCYWQPEDSCPVDSSSLKSSSISVGSSCASVSLSCSSGSSFDSYGMNDSQERKDSSSKDALMYTVSFYRKQKQETRTPPLKTIIRREQVESPPPENNNSQMIQERIKLLQEEILRQQTVIGQTSQALNLCHATAEFSGSTEQVEGERLLLIATQKRQACLNEIQRLKLHGAQRENIADGTGTLTISDIQLPLKREFISAQVEGKLNDAVHCFLCLIRHGAQVIVTQMVSTSDKIIDGALCFTNHITLQNLPPDFSVVFEVYALQTKKENLPHDKKYHIRREHSKMRLTPKGKKAEGKLFAPAISSPGGPHAVRTSSFGVIGYTRFNIQNCNRKCFTLDKVPFSSPLEGVLKLKLQLHAEQNAAEKGFLTMFEDVSGFGAWHRRWCYLNAQYLAYWKYPDDEHKKDPIGMIDLKQCITGEVKLVSRDICARPHTFQLVTVRPQEKGDKDTLISRKVNTLTTTKHLLSADTKEERIMWCNKLNEALTNVRKWDPQALRPMELKVE